MAGTVGDLLGSCLRAAGVRRVFGAEIPGLPHVPVDDPTMAALLADADGRTSCLGAAWLPGQRLRVGAAPGLQVPPARVEDPSSLPTAIARASRLDIPESAELVLPFGLDWEVPESLEPLMPADPPGDLGQALAKARDAGAEVVVLAGPGVVRTGHVEKLRHLVEVTGWGVINTWGAKGVFPWNSPSHLGTAGLQERDFQLAGFGDGRLVLLTGGDPRESPRARWDLGANAELHPRFLSDLAERWELVKGEPVRSQLYEQIGAVTVPLYEQDTWPRNPARAAFDLSASRPEGGLVAADPGAAGLWIARAFPTTELSSVVVPATRVTGFAAAAALVAALDDRPAVAVTTAPVDDLSMALLELAASLDLPLTLQVWGDEEGEQVVGGEARIQGVPVDFAATRDLVDVAGPVVAWLD